MSRVAETGRQRPLVALITNHGYAGPTPPIGAARDTGGQNVYVNDLARALEEAGKAVVIYTRGGFPEHGDGPPREGERAMSEHITYVYLPGGGEHFLAKEDIAVALDEELEALEAHVAALAVELGRRPWEVFSFVNSHYWDAGYLGYKLVERWQADFIYERLRAACGERLDPAVLAAHHRERHIRAVRHNWHHELGLLVLRSAKVEFVQDAEPEQLHQACMTALQHIDAGLRRYSGKLLARLQHARWPDFSINTQTVVAQYTGQVLADWMAERGLLHAKDIYRLNRHFWTPHSLGPIKERNYLDYPWERKRPLKFTERRHHERAICERTPLLVSTSEDISATLVGFFGVHPDRIVYFPPCISASFRPRPALDCHAALAYLSEICALTPAQLALRRLVLEVSRADRTKRKDLVLASFAELAPNRPELLLVMFGGPHNEVVTELLQAIAAEPRLAGRAFVVPETVPHEALVELFALAQLYVSASEMEGFGMSVLQAAASGTPVVCSRLVPFATHYLRGIAPIVAEQTPAAYASAMSELLDAPETYARMREQVLHASQDFTWARRLEDLEHSDYEHTIFFAEVQLDDYSVRLGEQRSRELLLSAAG